MMVVPLTAEGYVRGVWVHDAPLYKGPHRAQHGSHTHLQQSHLVEELPDLDCALMRLVSLELSLWTDVP
jgi:hypothetical protein